MEQKTEIRKRLRDQYSRLSPGQKKLADYVLDHYEQAAFMTAMQLGRTVGVSESTVIRFAAELGCKGYPQFQQELEGLLKKKIDHITRMEETYGDLQQPEILKTVLASDMQRIAATLEQVDGQAFEEALDLLDSADTIYVIGLRSCAPLAEYLHYYLHLIYRKVVLVDSSSEHELLEKMIYLNNQDMVFAIGFPRYSMRTLKILEFANSRQAQVVTLTDHIHSPMNLYSSCNLIAYSDMSSVAASFVAPMSVINALITAASMRHKERVLSNMELIEQTLEDYQVFGNDEIDLMEDRVELRPFIRREDE